jgi:ATP-dependent DNA helicase RecG
MITFDSPLSSLNRVGDTTAAHFKRLGINTAGDLLFYLPFRYDDFSSSLPIAKLKDGQTVNIIGTVDLIQNKRSAHRKMQITEALIRDDSGYLKLIWFNQSFITRNLKVGDEISVSGRVNDNYGQMQITSPDYEKISSADLINTKGLIPNYHSTNKVSQKQIRFLIKQVLHLTNKIEDWLPEGIRERLGLIDLRAALYKVHFPASSKEIIDSQRRLAFTELFLRQLKSQSIKRELQNLKATSINFNEEVTRSFVSGLPFPLTNDQKKAAWEILKDLQKNQPMSRLLEGDVGSGKTLVAVIALLNVAISGQQGALMVPTEILARQHFKTLSHYLYQYNIKVALLTSNYEEVNFEPATKNILEEADILVGTHALIQSKINIPRLSLAIVDEQHRFGVDQRHKIIGGDSKLVPHFLSMTATPIPRSLALAIYGDLDLSLITQLPAGRQPIVTKIVTDKTRNLAYDFIRKEIKNGRQIYVICPLIDESDKLGVKSAKSEFEKLQKEVFPEFVVGLLHGKMKAKEKEQVMSDFADNKINILVATSVIEVGVDVPNSTIMIIEGAERFGLAQLHQFRGRVGRSDLASYCFLIPTKENISNAKTLERLEALTKHNDGLTLAKIDLKLRGGGDLYGTMQSGFDELQIGSLFDYELIKKAKDEATELVFQDPEFKKHPAIKMKLGEWERKIHLE